MKRLPALACFSVLISVSLAQPIINTYAGGPPPSGTALQVPLPSPAAIATDHSGNTYIAASVLKTVYKLDSAGNLTRIAGNGTLGFSGDNEPAIGAQLFGPGGIAVDLSGNVYIADGYRIRMVGASTGEITTVAGNGLVPPLPIPQPTPNNDGPALLAAIAPQ